MVVLTCDKFVEVGIHVPGNTSTSERGGLPNTFVKESTARVKNSPVETVEVNLLDQLALVPERNFFSIFCFILLRLQVLAL